MGPCARGPVVVGEVDGTTYQRVQPEDVSRIIAEQRAGGSALEADEKDAGESLSGFFEAQRKIVLRNCGRIDPLEITDYIATGGYTALVRVLNTMDQDAIVEEVKKSGLRGRGGAGTGAAAGDDGDNRFWRRA